jgi:hypothetical protein
MPRIRELYPEKTPHECEHAPTLSEAVRPENLRYQRPLNDHQPQQVEKSVEALMLYFGAIRARGDFLCPSTSPKAPRLRGDAIAGLKSKFGERLRVASRKRHHPRVG